jgi:hypothetical protein
VEAVGEVLRRFGVPKYMVGYLVCLSSGEVENISLREMFSFVLTKDPQQAG